MNRYKVLITAAMLAAMSIVLELLPLPYPKIEFIKIDIVGVPLILASMLLGTVGGIVSAIVMGILLIFTPTGWVGAIMKIVATLPMIVLFGLLADRHMLTFRNAVIAAVAAIAIRSLGMVLFNYYFAIPVFFNIPTETAMAEFPALWIIIPNVILSLVEFAICAFLFFKTPLRETLR
ncbi:MAG: ECF transporter S component [Candidatus Diapherotrites archaeon]|uniref:ECF transporter S component n=1 Tax=Candidatus Iainarchaeum sp. TaxID=3101447 RepID=A0A8T4L648_9ARCH|nr:ECF transporter S component [Candidatus Diapherotrites archaeon]